MSIKEKVCNWIIKSAGLDINQMLSYVRREQGQGDGKVTRPYSQIEFVFVCVKKLIESIGSLNLVISTLDDQIVESGPAIDLLFKNKEYGWQKIIQDWVGHWALSNDVFITYLDRTNGLSKIQIVNGFQMRPITNTGYYSGNLIGWEFRGLYGETRRFDITEVYQTKSFNPYEKFHGQSPLIPAQNSINYSFASALYNASALQNGAEPGPIFTLDGNPDEAKIRAFLDSFENRHGGPNKAKRPCALSGVKDIKTIAQSMADLQVAEISKMSDTKICTTFGVPPELVGLGTEAQYSHGPAQRAFMFYTIMPLAKLFSDELTASVLNKFYPSQIRGIEFSKSKMFSGSKLKLNQRLGYCATKQKAVVNNQQLFAWFDFSQHPTIQEAMREYTKEILGFADRIPLNNLIQVHDLPYEEVPWGNEVFISPALMPARWIIDAGPEGFSEPSLPEGGDVPEPAKAIEENESEIEKANEAHRLRIWKNWKNSWAGIEREYTAAMRSLFFRQHRELLEKLQAAMNAIKSTEKAADDEVIARVVFDLQKEGNKIKAINRTFFEKASELGILQIASQIGLTGDTLTQFVETAKRDIAIRRALLIQAENIKGINKVTQEMVARQLRQGLKAGEGLPDLTARVKKTLDSNLKRAQSIARTQTGGAVSSGRHVGMQEAGIKLKGWLTSKDNHVRDTHKEAGKQYEKGIPLDEPFVVGGDFLMHPGDPNGSPANIINCRCCPIAVKSSNKTFTLSYYANLKFYSYEDMQKTA